jgi:hypothetical protein
VYFLSAESVAVAQQWLEVLAVRRPASHSALLANTALEMGGKDDLCIYSIHFARLFLYASFCFCFCSLNRHHASQALLATQPTAPATPVEHIVYPMERLTLLGMMDDGRSARVQPASCVISSVVAVYNMC